MERLTKKRDLGDGMYCTYTSASKREILDRLELFEDFMEEQGVDSLELLKATLKMKTQSIKGFEKLYQENQALKDRWQNLKDFIVDKLKCDRKFFELTENNMYYDFSIADITILDKMQELEKE